MRPLTYILGSSGRLGAVVAETFKARGDELIEWPWADDQNPVRLNYMVFAHRYRGDSYLGEFDCNVHKTVQLIGDAVWAEGDRAIVIVSSVSAVEPAYNQSLAYNLTKAALNQLARYHSKTIRSNTVSPNTFTGYRAVVTPKQVSEVIAFLCSPAGSGINGQDIRVG